MIDLNDYYYFVRVVDSKGITTASKNLNLPKSTISRRLSQLELRLGAQLIHRSSRAFVVSDLGWKLYEHARNMLREAEAAEWAVKNRLAAPGGTLRVACSPLASALCLQAALPEFLARFPDVCVEQRILSCLSETGMRAADVSFIAHDAALDDSSMIRRRLGSEPRQFVAAAAYAARMGDATRPEEVSGHPLLLFAEAPARIFLADRKSQRHVTLEPKSRLVSSDLAAVLSLVRAGLGVALLPTSCCEADIRSGDLIPVLPGWTCRPFEVSALLPSSKGVLPAARALIDFIGGRGGARVRARDTR